MKILLHYFKEFCLFCLLVLLILRVTHWLLMQTRNLSGCYFAAEMFVMCLCTDIGGHGNQQ